MIRLTNVSRTVTSGSEQLTILHSLDLIAARILLVGVLLAVAVWQAGSYPRARLFIAALAATAVVLNVAGSVLVAVLRRAGRLPSFAVRYAVGNLCRPGNQTKAVLFAVGIGTLFLVSVRQQQVNIESVYSLDLETMSADMFAIDIQPDQHAAAAAVLTAAANDVRLVPVVRTRLTGIKWAGAAPRGVSAQVAMRRAAGGCRVTYRSTPEPSETVVAGVFWDGTPSTVPEVSLEDANRYRADPAAAFVHDDLRVPSGSSRKPQIRERATSGYLVPRFGSSNQNGRRGRGVLPISSSVFAS